MVDEWHTTIGPVVLIYLDSCSPEQPPNRIKPDGTTADNELKMRIYS
jgi:hypothetical protein